MLALLLFLTPIPAQPKPDAVGTCPFGKIEIYGRKVVIVGPAWNAVGETKDGWAHLTWTGPGGRRATAQYWMDDLGWDGAYTYTDSDMEPISERFAIQWGEP